MLVNAELQGAIKRAEVVFQLAHQIFAKAHSRSELIFTQLLTLNFLARGMTTHRAVRLLVENGLNGEAAATMRTLVELDIDLAYILAEDTELRFQRFFEYDHVVMFRLIEDNPGALPPHRVQAIRELYNLVRANYPNPNRGWCGLSIKQRATAASRIKQYVTAYALGSGASHSGIGSLKYSLGSSGDKISLFTESREPHSPLLELATLALFRLGISVTSHLHTELDEEINSVATLLETTTLDNTSTNKG